MTATPSTPSSSGSNEQRLADALRSSLRAHEQLKQRYQQQVDANHEPIAIIAMGCRLPGGIDSPEKLWQCLEEGADVIGPLPDDRGWDIDALFGDDASAKAKAAQWQGGFVEDIAGFDAEFFRISNREALVIDPQQRFLMELAWEVLERANIVPATLKGSQTGVFIGSCYDHYIPDITHRTPETDGYRLQGMEMSMASGRISYTLGLNGPAVTIDTACSSSLTALHLAEKSLREKECDLAIVGATTLIAQPDVFVEFTRQGGLAADGRCKAFADAADGTGFSEGAGVLLLARLSDALAAGYPIQALIRGSALNQDGASNGLTAPSGPAQEQVIRSAVKNAQLTLAEVDAVEAHGTGTTLGDPIEANALLNTYGKAHSDEQPLWLGSVKSNLGHTQLTAGVVSIIKMVMALQHEQLPQTLHVDRPTTKVDWQDGGIKLLCQPQPWPRDAQHPRRAGISGFGFSGSNAHVIVEEAPLLNDEDRARPPLQPLSVNLPTSVLPISAASPDGLAAQARQLAEALRENSDTALSDIGHSLATYRTHFDYRAVVTAATREEAVAALEGIAEQRFVSGVAQGIRTAGNIAFLFSGQGAQWATMGRTLYAASPVFADALDALCDAFDPLLPQPLKSVMFAEKSSNDALLLNRTDFTQAALFTFEVALYRLLERLGITPDAVTGHSIGEIAAAHVAGVFSLNDAVRFVATRGRLMQGITRVGAMVAIETDEASLLASIGDDERISIAALNAPDSTVISGDEAAVLALAEQWKQKGKRTHRLSVSHAFHSPHIDSIVDELRATLTTLSYRAPRLPIISTVTGKPLTAEEACSPDYWAHQARSAVRFADAAHWLLTHNTRLTFEVGPDSVLAALGRANGMAHSGNTDTLWLAAMRRERDEARTLLAGLAALHAHGVTPDWQQLLPAAAPVTLPTYPFQHRHYWLTLSENNAPTMRHSGTIALSHAFLEQGVELADQSGWIFTGHVRPDEHPWIKEHRVHGDIAIAGAMTSEMIHHAGKQFGYGVVNDLVLQTLMTFPDGASADVQLRVELPNEHGQCKAAFYYRPRFDGNSDELEPTWIKHATLSLGASPQQIPEWEDIDTTSWPPQGAEPLDMDDMYRHLRSLGPAFRRLKAAWRSPEGVYFEADLTQDELNKIGRFDLHPVLLDTGLQAGFMNAPQAEDAPVHVLFMVSGLHIYAQGARSIRGLLTTDEVETNYEHSEHSVRLFDDTYTPVAEVKSFVLKSFDPQQARPPQYYRPPYRLLWKALEITDAKASADIQWVIPAASTVPTTAATLAQQALSDIDDARAALTQAPQDGITALLCTGTEDESPVNAAHQHLQQATEQLQRWLADAHTASRPMVWITRHAIATDDTEDVTDLAWAPLWGLIRTAQHEHPDRFLLIDLDEDERSWQALPAAIGTLIAERNSQGALRRGQLQVPKLTRTVPAELLPLPAGNHGTLVQKDASSLTASAFAWKDDAQTSLQPQQLRIAVRAAALPRAGFHTDTVAHGIAGVVEACGHDVSAWQPGDRVMVISHEKGLPVQLIVSEHDVLPQPAEWTFAEAATSIVPYTEAWQSLTQHASSITGHRLLIADASSTQGTAAAWLAEALGADVHAITPTGQLASAAEYDSASIHCVRPEEADQLTDIDVTLRQTDSDTALGRGKALTIAPLTSPLSFREEEAQALAATLASMPPLAPDATDVRYAAHALQRHALNTDDDRALAFTVPHELDQNGTVLITGATGALAQVAARHLASRLGMRHFLLASRRGPNAPQAERIVQDLNALGAEATLVACDVAKEEDVCALLDAVPAEHPLTAVLHAAGVVDTAMLDAMTPAQLHNVMRPKVDAAWHLHRLTRHSDLAAFVLYSTSVDLLTQKGQSGYAAANIFLDALAHHRRHQGLPASALAWGMWTERSEMGKQLGNELIDTIMTSGHLPLPTPQGLSYLISALGTGAESHATMLLPTRLHLAAFQDVPCLAPLLTELSDSATIARTAPQKNIAQQLAALSAEERRQRLLELAIQQVSEVLNHPDPSSIRSDVTFTSLGLDSLTSVETSQRLSALIGTRLPATIMFSHETPIALAEFLDSVLSAPNTAAIASSPQTGRFYAQLKQGVEQQRVPETLMEMANAAGARPQFSEEDATEHLTTPVWVRQQGNRPLLVCLNSFIPAAVDLTYQRLINGLGEQVDAVTIPLPGYQEVALPTTPAAAARALAETIVRCTDGRPFILLGFSTGGVMAYAVAEALVQQGVTPDSVVMIDSSTMSTSLHDIMNEVMGDWLTSKSEFWTYDDQGLGALAWYATLFSQHWTPTTLPAPVLLVQSMSPPKGVDSVKLACQWPTLTDKAMTPGRHFELLTTYVEHTTERVQELLARQEVLHSVFADE
ncbi:type I polyketide synthase [Zymobacter palmae]|uniref:Modular polyketide synthase n=1 Tax=Zymobacter palmae TaxID=33074 RepID=A0A348HC00_9GAMM|nr:type I polyketide synthase [Zymobacter palmae]BBG29152.1 modular polyketide synthase [Zymobacter palmae]